VRFRSPTAFVVEHQQGVNFKSPVEFSYLEREVRLQEEVRPIGGTRGFAERYHLNMLDFSASPEIALAFADRRHR